MLLCVLESRLRLCGGFIPGIQVSLQVRNECARSLDLFRRDADTFRNMELTFYQYDSGSCLVSLNGEKRLFVCRDSVVAIVENVNTLLMD